MLPFFTLQNVQLEPGDTLRQSAELLPPDATEPTALFAELLRSNVDVAQATLPHDGIALPVNGNPLPILSATTASVAPDGRTPARPAPVADALRGERLRPDLPPMLHGGQPGRNAAQPGLATVPATPQPQSAPTAAAPQPGIALPPVLQAGQALSPLPTADPVEYRPATDPRMPPTPGRDSASIDPVPRTAPEAAPAPALQNRPAETSFAAQPVAGAVRQLLEPANSPSQRRIANTLSTQPPDRVQREPLDGVPIKIAKTPASDLRSVTIAPPTPALPPTPVSTAATADVAFSPQPTPAAPTVMPLAPGAAAPPPQLHSTINLPVREPAWGEQLGERVQLMANSRLQNAEIRLTPAELGPLRVQVAVEDGNTTVLFHAQHAVTRDAIEQAMPRLRELLSESGLTLQQASVAGDDARQGSTQAGDPEREALDETHATREDSGADDEAVRDDDAAPRARPGRGLVDTFA